MNKEIHDYHEKIRRFIHSFVKDPALADDLTQDIMLKAWERRTQLFALEELEKYLLKMAKNHVIDHFKQLAKDQELQKKVWASSKDSYHNGHANLAVQDLNASIARIVQMLPPRQQEVFNLYQTKELDAKEIAEELNIAPNTAKNHLMRALSIIRSKLKPEAY